MAKNKVVRDEYMIRSLAYYQEQGGIYNELITILTNLRKRHRGMPTIAKILNEACYKCALVVERIKEAELSDKEQVYLGSTDYGMCVMTQWDEETGLLMGIKEPIDCYVLSVLLVSTVPGGSFIIDEVNKRGEKEKSFFAPFEHLLVKPEPKETSNKEVTILLDRIDDLEDEILAKDSLLADSLNKVSELEKLIENLSSKKNTIIDNALTFRTLMEYTENQKKYEFANQLVEMLKEICVNVGAMTEYQQVQELKQKLLEATVEIHNHNEIHDSNNFFAEVTDSSFPVQLSEEQLKLISSEILKLSNNGK